MSALFIFLSVFQWYAVIPSLGDHRIVIAQCLTGDSRKFVRQELGYRQQIARQLRTQYNEGMA